MEDTGAICKDASVLVPNRRERVLIRKKSGALAEVLFEFHTVGKFVRVAAIDPVSGIEVTIVGSPKHSETAMKNLALRKLLFVMGRKQKNKPQKKSTNTYKGRGILV